MNKIEEDIKELNDLENNKIELIKKVNDLSEGVEKFKNYSCYEQIKKELDIEKENLLLNENSIKEKVNLLKEYKNKIGTAIREDMNLIYEEMKVYDLNRTINNISSTIREIKQIIEDVEKNILLLEIINKYNFELDNKAEKPNEIKEEELILKKDLEFSLYNLNNKQGYSLKDFGNRYRKEIEYVYEFFDEDIDKTIEYLQKIHGLCPGVKIERNTFRNSCLSIFITKRVAKFNVYWNNEIIKGSSKKEIFLEAIKKIGVDKIYERFSHLFDSSFEISPRMIQSEYATIHKILCNDKIYYIKAHCPTSVFKNLLNKFKNVLNIHELKLSIE